MSQEKVLIIRNDHIGDLVLSTAVFREIKKNMPSCELTVVIDKKNKSLVEKNPYIDNFLFLEPPKYNLQRFWNFYKMGRVIRKQKFDIGFDLRGSLVNALFLLKFPGIKKRISRVDIHPIIRFLLTNPVEVSSKSHIIQDNIQIINEGLGLSVEDSRPEIFTDKEDKELVRKFLDTRKIKDYVCLCPFARLEEKQWPLQKWKEIIKWLGKKYPRKSVLLMGLRKEEEDLKKISELNKSSQAIIDFDLRRMSLLFKGADVVVTQDGGPMHIAWVSNSKLIQLHNLFLPWLKKFIPLGKNSKVVYTKDKSMDSISVEDVKKEILNFLN